MLTLENLEQDIEQTASKLRQLQLAQFALRWGLDPHRLQTLPAREVTGGGVLMRFAALTVGQLKQVLDALPDDLPVHTTDAFPRCTKATLYPDALVLKSVG